MESVLVSATNLLAVRRALSSQSPPGIRAVQLRQRASLTGESLQQAHTLSGVITSTSSVFPSNNQHRDPRWRPEPVSLVCEREEVLEGDIPQCPTQSACPGCGGRGLSTAKCVIMGFPSPPACC